MALAYALTTVSRLKTFLSISGSTYDTLLDMIVDATTDYIETYCDRRFKLTTYTNELYDGSGTDTLILRDFPISSSASFTMQQRDDVLNGSSFTTVETQSYFVLYDKGMVKLVGSTTGFSLGSSFSTFLNYPQFYRLTYSAGYDYNLTTTFLATVGAADLEYAAWKLAGAIFNQRKTQGNIQSESIGDYSVTFTRETMMDDELKAILSKYRRIPI